MALLGGLALGVSDRNRNAEAVVPILAEEANQARLRVLGILIGAELARDCAGKPRLGIERLTGEQPDRPGHPAFLLGRLKGFLDFDLGEQFRSEDVEIERAVARTLAAAVLRRIDVAQHFHAVELHAREIRAKPAQRDPPTLTGFARDLHAWQALERLGEVEFGEFGDVVGDDHILLDHGVTLDPARVAQRFAVASHDDLGVRRGGRWWIDCDLRRCDPRKRDCDHRRNRRQ